MDAIDSGDLDVHKPSQIYNYDQLRHELLKNIGTDFHKL